MNLEGRLTESLNDILRSSGYIFEIINKNKRQSNLITGSNNQLIPPVVSAQLGSSISKFDDILDETVSKFNDAKWCVEQMLESKLKQEETKLKEEERRREEIERKKLEEDRRLKEEQQRKLEEEKKKQELEERKRKEEELKKKQTQEEEERKRQADLAAQAKQDKDLFDDFISPDFDFSVSDVMGGVNDNLKDNNNNNINSNSNDNIDIPNPSDILSSIDYTGFETKQQTNKEESTGINDNNNEELDINNILGNNDLILDGLNMGLLEQGEGGDQAQSGDVDDFDVDNFLNQFAGND